MIAMVGLAGRAFAGSRRIGKSQHRRSRRNMAQRHQVDLVPTIAEIDEGRSHLTGEPVRLSTHGPANCSGHTLGASGTRPEKARSDLLRSELEAMFPVQPFLRKVTRAMP